MIMVYVNRLIVFKMVDYVIMSHIYAIIVKFHQLVLNLLINLIIMIIRNN